MDSEKLIKLLVDERAARLKDYDDAYPDIGWGMSKRTAIRQAIKELKQSNLIPSDYEYPE